jgi:hypothetical protein
LLFYHILTVRPQLFTYLLFLATLCVLKRVEGGRTRWLLALPPLFALWINLHGGVLAGWGVLVAWSVSHLFIRWLKPARTNSSTMPAIVAALLLSTAALLVNPYGFLLPDLLVKTATVARPDIEEWRSLAESRYHFIGYLALLSASFWGIVSSRRSPKPALLVVYLITAVTPLLAIRHLPLFAIASVVLAGESIAESWNRLPSGITLGVINHRSDRIERGVAVFSLAAGLLFLACSAPNYGCIPIPTRLVGSFPARAVAVLKRTEGARNLVTHFNWGEYVIWHLGPRIKVSIDGRRETVYSEEMQAVNHRFARGEGDWAAIIRRPETDLVLMPRGSAAFNLMALCSEWAGVYDDPLCGIFARRGAAWAQEITKVSAPDVACDAEGLCFP